MDAFDLAIESAKIHGGGPYDYWRLHCWIDLPKILGQSPFVGFFRHHIEGVMAGKPLFTTGALKGSISDQAVAAYEDIARRHLTAIYGVVPTAEMWLRAAAADDGEPPILPTLAEIAASSAEKFGGSADDYLPLHAWMMAPVDWRSEWDTSIRCLLFRHNSVGIFEAEEYFGPEYLGPGSQVKTKDLAYHHIMFVIGDVPNPSDIMAELTLQPWMNVPISGVTEEEDEPVIPVPVFSQV